MNECGAERYETSEKGTSRLWRISFDFSSSPLSTENVMVWKLRFAPSGRESARVHLTVEVEQSWGPPLTINFPLAMARGSTDKT